MRDIILHLIEVHNGIKGVDLALKVMEEVSPHSFIFDEYYKLMIELVDSGEIREVEYFTLSMDYRVKSIFFSKDTRFMGFGGENVRTSQVIMDGESQGDTQVP